MMFEEMEAKVNLFAKYRGEPVSGIDGMCELLRAEAWKAAFEWFHFHMERPDEGPAKDSEYFAEYERGFALIRDKLK